MVAVSVGYVRRGPSTRVRLAKGCGAGDGLAACVHEFGDESVDAGQWRLCAALSDRAFGIRKREDDGCEGLGGRLYAGGDD